MPHADDRTFFYGANFEFSINAHRWDAKRFTSEIRPIIGWHLKPVDIIVNPIVDTAYDGLKNLEFVPATRVAYNFPSGWTARRRGRRQLRPDHGCVRAASRRTSCTPSSIARGKSGTSRRASASG